MVINSTWHAGKRGLVDCEKTERLIRRKRERDVFVTINN